MSAPNEPTVDFFECCLAVGNSKYAKILFFTFVIREIEVPRVLGSIHPERPALWWQIGTL